MSWMPLLGFVPWLMERLAKTSKFNGLAQNHSHDFIELFNDRISDPIVAIDPIFARLAAMLKKRMALTVLAVVVTLALFMMSSLQVSAFVWWPPCPTYPSTTTKKTCPTSTTRATSVSSEPMTYPSTSSDSPTTEESVTSETSPPASTEFTVRRLRLKQARL